MRVESKIVRVTVSEDRAHVVRRAEIELPAGTTRIAIEGVAPVLADKTVKVSAGAGVDVADVRIDRRRVHLATERPLDVAALDAEIDALVATERDLTRRRKRLELELKGIDALIAQVLADIAVDASWGKVDAAAARARVRELERDEKERREAFLRAVDEHRRASEHLLRAKNRRATHGEPETCAVGKIEIALAASAPGRVELQVEYIVPGACWRPQHTAHLRDGRLRFSTDACVWQNTGEAWDDVELAFSTERPSLGREPPLLATDCLTVQRKQEGFVVETREEEVFTAGLGQASRAASVVPGIDDGGEVRVLRAAARASIATDGRPHRVPLASFETDARAELVMMPALAPLAIKKTTQSNAGAAPILAGPVDLVAESGVVGRTQVLFVAPGERFALGWGPDPGVRARRAVEEADEDAPVLGSWLSRVTRVTLHLSALDDASRSVAVTEAVPVSETEKVQIAVDAKETTDGAKPDDDGLVRWDVPLGPHGRAQVKLRYVLKRHRDVTGL